MSNRIGKSGEKRCLGGGRFRGTVRDAKALQGNSCKEILRNTRVFLKNGAIALPGHFGMRLAPPSGNPFLQGGM
jgi:hypothetical protein